MWIYAAERVALIYNNGNAWLPWGGSCLWLPTFAENASTNWIFACEFYCVALLCLNYCFLKQFSFGLRQHAIDGVLAAEAVLEAWYGIFNEPQFNSICNWIKKLFVNGQKCCDIYFGNRLGKRGCSPQKCGVETRLHAFDFISSWIPKKFSCYLKKQFNFEISFDARVTIQSRSKQKFQICWYWCFWWT